MAFRPNDARLDALLEAYELAATERQTFYVAPSPTTGEWEARAFKPHVRWDPTIGYYSITSDGRVYARVGEREEQLVGHFVDDELALIENPIRFEEELRGSHHGQQDLTLYAYDDHAQVMGFVDYDLFQGDVHVQIVEVRESDRRRGVGAQLFRELSRLYPDSEIHSGMLTGKGAAFVRGLPLRMERGFDE